MPPTQSAIGAGWLWKVRAHCLLPDLTHSCALLLAFYSFCLKIYIYRMSTFIKQIPSNFTQLLLPKQPSPLSLLPPHPLPQSPSCTASSEKGLEWRIPRILHLLLPSGNIPWVCLRQEKIFLSAEFSWTQPEKPLCFKSLLYRSIDHACGCFIVPKCSWMRGVQKKKKKREREISKTSVPRAH